MRFVSVNAARTGWRMTTDGCGSQNTNDGISPGRKKMNQDQFTKIISDAVEREVEAFTFYQAVSEKTADQNLKRLFKDLADEEAKHRRTLEGYLMKGAAKIHFSQAADYKVTDGLATPPLTPDMKPVDGLVIAIKNELEAMQMYTQLARACEDEDSKNIFLELATMERGHKNKLEEIYTNMAFPEAW
jgi:rubrerythrin